MSGQLPKLNMAAVDDAAAKKKAKKKDKKTVKDRVDRGRALVRQASASLKRGLTPRGSRASEVSHEERSGSDSGAEDYPALTGALGPRDSISALSDSDAESSEEVSYAATTEAPSAGGAELEADLKDPVPPSPGGTDPGHQSDLNATHDKPPTPGEGPAAVSAPAEGSFAAATGPSVIDDAEPESDLKNSTSLPLDRADSEQQRTLKPAEDAAPAMEKRYQEISPAPATPADPGATAEKGEEKASADGGRSKWRNLAIAVAVFAVGAVATEPALNALRKPKEPNAPLVGQEMAHKGRTWGFR